MTNLNESDHQNKIAVIGMTCRFPGAKNVDEFWQNLQDGVESVSFFSDDELLAEGVDPAALSAPNFVKAGAILDDVELFDASFFGFSPKEAKILDPQHRIFMECAWECLESAGYNPETYDGLIGVYAGKNTSGYLIHNIHANPDFFESVDGLQILLGNDRGYLASHVSYKLNLTGPSMGVQTACSTSLVAVHLASQSLMNYECDIALAGGITVNIPQKTGYKFPPGGVVSPDGHCRAFDAQAEGTIFGNGVGIVALKRLEDALADGDFIHAVIKGSAVNNDGSAKAGYSAPGEDGQARAISEALAVAGVEPETVTYIEAHGSGTALGDPIEMAALMQVFRARTQKRQFCAVGSVKTNVGHLESAAGAAGLIKTVLALKHKMMPASLNFQEANPHIDFDNSPFYVNTQLREWPALNGQPRLAGVSSFGMGGTNAHVVLEEAPEVEAEAVSKGWQLLLLSAQTASALEQATANLQTYLQRQEGVNMADAAYTLQVGRKVFAHRRMVVCRGREDALAGLANEGGSRLWSSVQEEEAGPVAFMFPGVGDHYENMGRELYEREPRFRQTIDECCARLAPILGGDLRTMLYPAERKGAGQAGGMDLRQMLGRGGEAGGDQPLQQTRWAQPAVFVVEYALADLLQSWGIKPTALIGYSLGEYVAACVAGVMSLEDGAMLVARRAQMIEALPAGRMIAVSLSASAVQPYLGQGVDLAVVNGPGTCVLGGPEADIERVAAALTAAEVSWRRLPTSHAFHTHMMKPMVADFTALVAGVPLQAPRIPYLSNVTGMWITDAEATDPHYWARHLCQTVHFGEGVAELLADPGQILLEVGAGQALGSFAKQHPRCRPEQVSRILATMRYAYDRQSDEAFLLSTVGKLWLAGCTLDWQAYYDGERRQRLPLPTYPFERQRYWVEPAGGSRAVTAGKRRERREPGRWFYEPVWEATAVATATTAAAGSWLIFADEAGWGAALSQQLRHQGATVVQVQRGEGYARQGADSYTIRPDQAADYATLLAELAAAGPLPTQVVHLWSLGCSETGSAAAFQAAQRLGFYSLLYLAQALGQRHTSNAVQMTAVVHNVFPVDADTTAFPELATILGPCLVIPQEHQNIRCRVVEMPLPEADNIEAEFVLPLASEVMAPITEPLVAYQAGTRHVRRFVPRQLVADPGIERIRPGGVYLLVGGLGSIGLTLAEYLAQQAQARLVLTSRSGLPSRELWDDWLEKHSGEDPTAHKIQAIRSLESLGAEVLVIAADISNETQMRSVIDQTRARFGPLNGVIHVAGLVDRQALQPVQSIDQKSCERHFSAKVYGLYSLDKVLQGENLDFCVLFSSLSAILGGIGFSAYAAANLFMDAYTHTHNRHSSTAWRSVNWDVWQVGATPERSTAIQETSLAEFAMSPEEGKRAFALAMASDAPQLAQSTGDLQARIRQWVLLEAVSVTSSKDQTSHARPSLTTSYVAPDSKYEKEIMAIWQQVLGVEQIGIYDNFFDLGGNSLIGLQVISKLQEIFGISISTVALFEAPTISALAKYLQPQTQPQEDSREQFLTERRQKARQNVNDQEIAIIGMSGYFPGARTLEQFWENLCNGEESITFFTDEELLAAGIRPDLLSHPAYVKSRPILEDIDKFDAHFFGYSPREAELLDPQHRLFLECAWEALERSGYNNPDVYKGEIGVFAGVSISSYMMGWYTNPQLSESVNAFQMSIAGDKDALPTTVSYKLDLKGPSFAVQTFCSTSLVAAHIACQNLVNGECDIALAGGSSIYVPQKQGYLFEVDGMASPDGRCRPFSDQGNGAAFGDGVGVVVLKRLADALEDGDVIHAVIKGSAVNNDGALKVGYTAPSVSGQAKVVSMALERANINPETIGFVEAHGSATKLGDPIEVRALTQAFHRQSDQKAYCAIGSVKGNVGHLDRAAGVVGLIKAVLAVKHGVVPPTVHFDKPNPEIDFANSPFFVNKQLMPWPAKNGNPRRAGVNSLGMGGTNAHVIVEEPPSRGPSGSSRPRQLLLLSGRTELALDTITANLAHYLRQNPEVNLADVAYTLQVGKRSFPYRRIAVCQDMTDALSVLESVDPHRVLSHRQPDIDRVVTFMFPGVGEHYLGMGRELYEQEPVFKDVVTQCDQVLYPYLGTHLQDLLYVSDQPKSPQKNNNGVDLRAMLGRNQPEMSPAAKKLKETAVAQPIVFVIEYALARLLMSWGVRPQAMVGYSLGEYVAACLSGVLSLADALKLVVERAQMIQALPAGSMLAVSLTEEAVQALLTPDISLAAHNGDALYVLAGPPAAIEQLQTQLTDQGIACRQLETTHAFHSSMMLSLVEPLTELVKTVQLSPPQIPYLSNVTGKWVQAEEATDPTYWANHMCQPIRFFDGVGELLKEQEHILLEVGPGQSLGAFAKQHPGCTGKQLSLILPTLPYEYEQRSDLAALLETLGKLWLLGVKPDWLSFYQGETRHIQPLPTYPFERRRYWVEPGRIQFGQGYAVETPLADDEDDYEPRAALSSLPREALADWFYLPGWKQRAANIPHFPAEEPACWLLFADADGWGAQVAVLLARHNQHVFIVQEGDAFQQKGERQFTVRPRFREDYVALLSTLRQQKMEPTKIVHMWSVTAVDTPANQVDFLDRVLDLGFHSLMGLVQAIAELNLGSCELSIVSSQGVAVMDHETLCPQKATLIGPCRTVHAEFTNITCRLIDVALELPDSWQAEMMLTNLLGELTAVMTDSVVALRRQQRWVESFEPVALPPVPTEAIPLLRPGGTYMVTGGLGGIGLAMAEHLARTANANIILLSRSGLPPRTQWDELAQGNDDGIGRKVQHVQHLEALGAQVLVAAADVTDEAQMQSVVQQAVTQFGTIHGVIHAAGVPGMGLIQLKTPEMATEVLAPKVHGTLVLEKVLAGVELDFLVLFSSIASVTGAGLGQLDYCAANAFMDAYAQHHACQKRATISIDWGEWQWNAWDEGIAAFGPEFETFLKENRAQFGISFVEGGDALNRIMARRWPRIVVSTQNFSKIIEYSKRFTIATLLQGGPELGTKKGSKYPRPALMVPYVPPASTMEKRIAEIWQNFLGIDQIGIHDNFFELGGHSLMAMQIVSQLQQLAQVHLPLSILLVNPTIEDLTVAVEIAIIEELEDLSDEEALSLTEA